MKRILHQSEVYKKCVILHKKQRLSVQTRLKAATKYLIENKHRKMFLSLFLFQFSSNEKQIFFQNTTHIVCVCLIEGNSMIVYNKRY